MSKVFIGIPSGGSESTLFSTLLMGIWVKSNNPDNSNSNSNPELTIEKVLSPYICRNRNDLVRMARAEGATHLMFMDNDMLLPEDVVSRLLGADKDVVCGNYVTKAVPARPMCIGFEGEYVYSTPKKEGLERVYKAPTGCMLIKMEVFDRVATPYFHVPPRGEDVYSVGGYALREGGDGTLPVHPVHAWYLEQFDWNIWKNAGGEDYWFTHNCARAGVEVWVDHDLSKSVSHMGSYPYSMLDAARTDNYTENRFSAVKGLEYKRDG